MERSSATSDRSHETTLHPALGTVLVTNKNPLSLSLAKVDQPFSSVRRYHPDNTRSDSCILSHVKHLIRSDAFYSQSGSFL